MLTKMQDKVSEAEQHVKTLEELNKKLSAIVWNFKEYGNDDLYKEALEAIKALNFAIDFIKWGMK